MSKYLTTLPYIPPDFRFPTPWESVEIHGVFSPESMDIRELGLRYKGEELPYKQSSFDMLELNNDEHYAVLIA